MLRSSLSRKAVAPAGLPAPRKLPSIPSSRASLPSGPPPSHSARVAPKNRIKSIKVGVLLDGDADFFTSAYTSKGRQGGLSAALKLKNHVERFIRHKTLGNSKNVKPLDIIAFSFMNMQGLTLHVRKNMASFAQGFNSSPYAFSMSDTGNQPQGADMALKSHLPFLLSTCDYVLFGGSHDNGYHKTLSGLVSTGDSDKVILLRTRFVCAGKISLLGLNEARFPMLFGGKDPTKRSRFSPASMDQSKVSHLVAPRGLTSTVVQQPPTSSIVAQHTAPLAPSPSTKARDYKPLVRLFLAASMLLLFLR